MVRLLGSGAAGMMCPLNVVCRKICTAVRSSSVRNCRH